MLELKNICFSVKEHGKTKEILKNISFNFVQGKNYLITGANGSGKSTLAKIVMGIIKPTSGKILFDGKDITNLDISARAKLGIAFAMQQPVKFKGLTVKDMLSFACEKDLQHKDVCKFLSQVGLCTKDYLNRELDATLSGGELKRIELATVLARRAKLNIFDEPEAGIDIWSFNALVDVFKNILSKDSTSIIISHQERLFKIADEILLVDDGQIKASGKPSKILPLLENFRTCKKMEGKN